MPGLRIDFTAYDTNPKYKSWVDQMARPYNLDLERYRADQTYQSWVDSKVTETPRPMVADTAQAPARPAPTPEPKSAPSDDRPGLGGTISDYYRGVMTGLSKAGTSLVGGAGYVGELLGAEDNALQRFAKETEAEAKAYYDPRGTAGKIGAFAGEALGAIGTGAGIAKGAGMALTRVAPRAAAALQGAAPVGQRVLAQTAVNAPIDVLQGLSQEQGGMVLPGRAGAVAENVLFSAAGGLLPGGKAAKAGEEAVPPPPGRRAREAARAREGVETTGRQLEAQTERIARDGDIPANITPEDYINVARLSDDPDVQVRLLRATQRAVEETDIPGRLPARPGEKLGRLEEPETFEQVRQRVADDLGISPAEVIARTKRGERIGRDDLLRVETALKQVVAEENELYKRIQSGAFETAEEAASAQAFLDRLRNESNGLLNVISKQKTETARDLAAMRIGALQSGDPAVWIGRMQALAKRTLSDAERAAVYKAATEQDFDTLVRLGREVQKSTAGEKVVAFFRANVLTNLKTHAINVTGNVGMRLLETAKDVPATLFDILLSKSTGIRTKDLSLRDLATGGMRAADQAVKDAWRVLRQGENIDYTKLDIPRQVNFDSPIANAYVHGVFRFLSAEDQLFKTFAYTRSLEEQARIIAKAKGLKGQALIDDVQASVRKPSAQMEVQAGLDADVATFRQNSEFAKAAERGRGMLVSGFSKFMPQDYANATADLVLLFRKTPANIASTIVDYTPLGAARPLTKFFGVLKKGSATAAEQKQIVETLGRSSIGSAAMAVGYFLAQDDKMTGFYPFDEKTRKEWEATGRTEGSIKLGDTWYQANRLSPLGNLMTIGAAMHQLEQGDPDMASLIIGTVSAPASAVYDLPMVSGLRDAIDIFRPGMAGQRKDLAVRYFGRMAQGFVPFSGLVRGVARGLDTQARETRTDEGVSFGRTMQAAIPGAAQQLPVKLTGLGEPVRRAESVGGSMLESLLSPVSASRARTATDPLLKELERAKAVPMPLERRKGESDADFATRQQTIGGVMRQALTEVVNDPEYAAIQQMDPMELRQILAFKRIDTNKLSDAQVRTRYQRMILDDVMRAVRSTAGQAFPSPYPEVVP